MSFTLPLQLIESRGSDGPSFVEVLAEEAAASQGPRWYLLRSAGIASPSDPVRFGVEPWLPSERRMPATDPARLILRPRLARRTDGISPDMVALTAVEPAQPGVQRRAATWLFSAEAWSASAPARLRRIAEALDEHGALRSDAPSLFQRLASEFDPGHKMPEPSADAGTFARRLAAGQVLHLSPNPRFGVVSDLLEFARALEDVPASIRPWLSFGAGFDEVHPAFTLQILSGARTTRPPAGTLPSAEPAVTALPLSSFPWGVESALWTFAYPDLGLHARRAVARAYGASVQSILPDALRDETLAAIGDVTVVSPDRIAAWADDPYRPLLCRWAARRSPLARETLMTSVAIAAALEIGGSAAADTVPPPNRGETVERLSRLLPKAAAMDLAMAFLGENDTPLERAIATLREGVANWDDGLVETAVGMLRRRLNEDVNPTAIPATA